MFSLILAAVTELPGSEIVQETIKKTTTELGLYAVLVFGCLFILGLLHFLFVHIPNNKMNMKKTEAEIENSKKLTKTIEDLASVTTDTHLNTKTIGDKITNLQAKMATILTIKQEELEAISVVSEKTGVDLSRQLDKAQGALSMLSHFEQK